MDPAEPPPQEFACGGAVCPIKKWTYRKHSVEFRLGLVASVANPTRLAGPKGAHSQGRPQIGGIANERSCRGAAVQEVPVSMQTVRVKPAPAFVRSNPLSDSTMKSIIMADTVIEGDVVGKGQVTVNGRVQGNLSAQSVEISQTGGIYGSLRAQSAEVHGDVQGDVSVIGLIRIGETGSVNGKVEYGKIAMEQGGTLSATLRNVPPHLAGDLHLTVDRGGAARITTVDLTAFDPDDAAEDLTYTVTNPTNGFVAMAAARSAPISEFTQADLEGGRIVFVHDGTSATTAGFDTIVSDAKGATSGKVQHVQVSVRN